jgi:hypothetical protein
MQRRSLLLGWFVTVFLAVASLIPAGMMPVDDGLRLTVRFCSENPLLDTQTIVIPREADSRAHDEDNPCIFAALSVLADLMRVDQWPLAIIASSQMSYLVVAHAAPSAGLAAPPPFATGPPLSDA